MIWPFYNYYYAKKLLFIIFLFHNVYCILRLKLNSGLKKNHRCDCANHSILKFFVVTLFDWLRISMIHICKYTLLSICFLSLFMWGLDEIWYFYKIRCSLYRLCTVHIKRRLQTIPPDPLLFSMNGVLILIGSNLSQTNTIFSLKLVTFEPTDYCQKRFYNREKIARHFVQYSQSLSNPFPSIQLK